MDIKCNLKKIRKEKQISQNDICKEREVESVNKELEEFTLNLLLNLVLIDKGKLQPEECKI